MRTLLVLAVLIAMPTMARAAPPTSPETALRLALDRFCLKPKRDELSVYERSRRDEAAGWVFRGPASTLSGQWGRLDLGTMRGALGAHGCRIRLRVDTAPWSTDPAFGVVRAWIAENMPSATVVKERVPTVLGSTPLRESEWGTSVARDKVKVGEASTQQAGALPDMLVIVEDH